MSKLQDFIDTLDLDVDATYRCDCPVCHGKNTFTVTNDKGNVLYNCYKNSCGISGVRHVNMDAFTINALMSQGIVDNTHQSIERFDIPPYMRPITQDIPEARTFMTKYTICPDDVMYDIRQDRVVFPVHHEGMLVDAVGRSVTNRQPKWLRYGVSPVPYMHGHGDVMVIVEDAISAYVVGEYFPQTVGVALLGTQLTPFHKELFFTKYQYNSFIIALDPDALPKTLEIKQELESELSDVKALLISDDLKYMIEEDFNSLKEMLNG